MDTYTIFESILAIGCVTILIVQAVQRYRSGMSIRWYIAGAIGMFVAASVIAGWRIWKASVEKQKEEQEITQEDSDVNAASTLHTALEQVKDDTHYARITVRALSDSQWPNNELKSLPAATEENGEATAQAALNMLNDSTVLQERSSDEWGDVVQENSQIYPIAYIYSLTDLFSGPDMQTFVSIYCFKAISTNDSDIWVQISDKYWNILSRDLDTVFDALQEQYPKEYDFIATINAIESLDDDANTTAFKDAFSEINGIVMSYELLSVIEASSDALAENSDDELLYIGGELDNVTQKDILNLIADYTILDYVSKNEWPDIIERNHSKYSTVFTLSFTDHIPSSDEKDWATITMDCFANENSDDYEIWIKIYDQYWQIESETLTEDFREIQERWPTVNDFMNTVNSTGEDAS